MNLSPKAIQSFQQLYLSQYGIELTAQEADQKGTELLNFFKLIYRPVLQKDAILLSSFDTSLTNVQERVVQI